MTTQNPAAHLNCTHAKNKAGRTDCRRTLISPEKAVDLLFAHALVAYDSWGWDIITETYTRADALYDCTHYLLNTWPKVHAHFLSIARLHDEHRASIQSS